MNKKILSVIIVVTAIGLLVPINLLKAETSEPTSEEDKTQLILDEVRNHVKEKTLGEAVNDQIKLGWIGRITEISSIGFEIQPDDENEEVRPIILSDEATIINQNRQTINFSDLEVNNRVIAMGYKQIDNSLDCRRVIITDQPEPIQRQSIFGSIIEKAEQEEILLIRNNDQSYELIFNDDSVIRIHQNNQIEEIKYADLTVNQKIVGVISPTDGSTETFKVEIMLVISSPQDNLEAPDYQTDEE